jgi:hypothetical protein
MALFHLFPEYGGPLEAGWTPTKNQNERLALVEVNVFYSSK